jgi:hypothetical protein
MWVVSIATTLIALEEIRGGDRSATLALPSRTLKPRVPLHLESSGRGHSGQNLGLDTTEIQEVLAPSGGQKLEARKPNRLL